MKIDRLASVFALLLLAGAALGQPVFQVGNLNPPVPPSVEFLHSGMETYAYLIYPPDQFSCTEGGFRLLDVNMYLEFTSDQVPVNFSAFGGLAGAEWHDGVGQWMPGPYICEGLPFIFHIEEPGLHVITVPLDAACTCQIFDEHYFLTLHYVDNFEANLPTDGQPEPGIVYNDKGAGWVDMIDMGKTAGGKVIIWGDLVCCEPVSNQIETWGAIKNLFR